MELIDRILSDRNIEAAIHAVKSNRGAAGIDKMTVDALEAIVDADLWPVPTYAQMLNIHSK